MADLCFLQAFASVLLTLSVFLVCTEESFSSHGDDLPVTIMTRDTDKYVGVLGDVPFAEIKMLRSSYIRTPQWFSVNGSLQWERNRTYCLTPVCTAEGLSLKLCSSEAGVWRKSSAYMYNNKCPKLVLTRLSDKVFMAPVKRSQNQSWVCTFEFLVYLKRSLPLTYPIKPNVDEITDELLKSLINTFTPVTHPLPFIRDVVTFPGNVKSRTPRISETVAIMKVWQMTGKSNLSALMTTPEFWQPTQLYAPPGEIIEVILPNNFSISHARGVILRVGAHNKVLTTGKYLRMPIVTEHYTLYPGVNKVRSQYGGNLIFQYVTNKSIIGDIFVNKVVEAPYFELHVTNEKHWKMLRFRDAPYAVLVGTRSVIIASTNHSRKLKNPEVLLKKYDRNIILADQLSGFDKSDPPPQGRYWFINGIQPELPLTPRRFPTSVDHHVHNLVDEKTPNAWGIFQYIGFMYYQRIWEPLFGSTALANLFAMFMHERVYNSSMVNTNISSKVYQDLKEGKTFQDVSEKEKLIFFKDLMRVSDKNWDIFWHLHRRGRRLTKGELEDLTKDSQYLLDFVYSELSLFSNKDLYSVFNRWGFMINPETRRKVQNKLKVSKPTSRENKRQPASSNPMPLFEQPIPKGSRNQSQNSGVTKQTPPEEENKPLFRSSNPMLQSPKARNSNPGLGVGPQGRASNPRLQVENSQSRSSNSRHQVDKPVVNLEQAQSRNSSREPEETKMTPKEVDKSSNPMYQVDDPQSRSSNPMLKEDKPVLKFRQAHSQNSSYESQAAKQKPKESQAQSRNTSSMPDVTKKKLSTKKADNAQFLSNPMLRVDSPQSQTDNPMLRVNKHKPNERQSQAPKPQENQQEPKESLTPSQRSNPKPQIQKEAQNESQS